MNILAQTLPVSVVIDGINVAIDTDFRAGLRIMLAFEDTELTSLEKQQIMFANIYPEIPLELLGKQENIMALLDKAIWYLNCGEDDQNEGAPRLMSFQKDARLIFAAFRSTHGIDLQSATMHWWSFVALMMDLGQDTAFCQLTGLRKRHKKGTLTKEERAMVREMGDAFVIEQTDNMTLEEMEADKRFMEQIKAAKENRNKEKMNA
jgi:hypothetical protein